MTPQEWLGAGTHANCVKYPNLSHCKFLQGIINHSFNGMDQIGQATAMIVTSGVVMLAGTGLYKKKRS